MSPKVKGYTHYLQAELPGSELKGLGNPYAPFTREYKAFQEGEREGVLEAQDAEE